MERKAFVASFHVEASRDFLDNELNGMVFNSIEDFEKLLEEKGYIEYLDSIYPIEELVIYLNDTEVNDYFWTAIYVKK